MFAVNWIEKTKIKKKWPIFNKKRLKMERQTKKKENEDKRQMENGIKIKRLKK